MEDNLVLEMLIKTLREKLSQAVYNIAELETLLILERNKNEKLTAELDSISSNLEKEEK